MTTLQRSRFLDLRALAALERMRFATDHRIEGTYSGHHRSRQQGGAGEFVDYRECVGSEDLRRLDWKVLARTGKAFIRLHQEETNLLATLAVDATQSMLFGGASPNRGIGVEARVCAVSGVGPESRDRPGAGSGWTGRVGRRFARTDSTRLHAFARGFFAGGR